MRPTDRLTSFRDPPTIAGGAVAILSAVTLVPARNQTNGDQTFCSCNPNCDCHTYCQCDDYFNSPDCKTDD